LGLELVKHIKHLCLPIDLWVVSQIKINFSYMERKQFFSKN